MMLMILAVVIYILAGWGLAVIAIRDKLVNSLDPEGYIAFMMVFWPLWFIVFVVGRFLRWSAKLAERNND